MKLISYNYRTSSLCLLDTKTQDKGSMNFKGCVINEFTSEKENRLDKIFSRLGLQSNYSNNPAGFYAPKSTIIDEPSSSLGL